MRPFLLWVFNYPFKSFVNKKVETANDLLASERLHVLCGLHRYPEVNELALSPRFYLVFELIFFACLNGVYFGFPRIEPELQTRDHLVHLTVSEFGPLNYGVAEIKYNFLYFEFVFSHLRWVYLPRFGVGVERGVKWLDRALIFYFVHA
jgi:hypothetical protein